MGGKMTTESHKAQSYVAMTEALRSCIDCPEQGASLLTLLQSTLCTMVLPQILWIRGSMQTLGFKDYTYFNVRLPVVLPSLSLPLDTNFCENHIICQCLWPVFYEQAA